MLLCSAGTYLKWVEKAIYLQVRLYFKVSKKNGVYGRDYLAMEERRIRRGDIYHADLNPVFGSEQGGYRPVLVIQNDIGNQYSPTVIIAAITSKPKSKLPTHVAISADIKGLEKDSVVLLEQLRTLDKRRLDGYIATLDRRQMLKIDEALCSSTGLRKMDKPIVCVSVRYVQSRFMIRRNIL